MFEKHKFALEVEDFGDLNPEIAEKSKHHSNASDFGDDASDKPSKFVKSTVLDGLGVEPVGSYDSLSGEAGSEVVSYFAGKLYVTNGAEGRIDVFDAISGDLINSIDLTTIPDFGGVNSVTVTEHGIAAAVELENDGDGAAQNGVVALFDLTGAALGTAEVGNLPDMVTYSKDGTMIFVANEGERQSDQEPAGSISIIDVATMTVATFGFEEFDAMVPELRDMGVRIFPDAMPSTDFEPEYIAEIDGKLLVTLQEANSVAVFDLASMSWEKIIPLGTQDHSVVPLDASDKDDAINITTYENLVGIRMPDAIAATEIDGVAYFLTANEGDDRGDFDEGGDAARVGDILDGEVAGVSIDASVQTTGLERLTVSIIDGDTDGDGDIDVLHAYGSRSFTIFDLDGNVVFNSGSDFEEIIAAIRPANAFNNDSYPSDNPDVIDENRSDNKGPEPEAIAIGEVDGKTLAFIGLERDGGIVIYDISNPADSQFVDYIDSSAYGHSSPEVIKFIPASESETGNAQIAVAYEISGTTALYDIAFGKAILGSNKSDDILGTIGDDGIRAGNGKDIVNGLGGDDEIKGENGNDVLFGGAGNDKIIGGNGADIIDGGIGDDLLIGCNGPDTFVFALGAGNDTIQGFGQADVIDLSMTGLSFGDLVISDVEPGLALVEYGDMGDTIEVYLRNSHATLDAGDFQF